VQEGRHALPFCETFFEFEHLVFKDADLFGYEYEFSVTADYFRFNLVKENEAFTS
jgi:hypothetical protein